MFYWIGVIVVSLIALNIFITIGGGIIEAVKEDNAHARYITKHPTPPKPVNPNAINVGGKTSIAVILITPAVLIWLMIAVG